MEDTAHNLRLEGVKKAATRRLIQPGVLDEGKENQAGCSVLSKGVPGTGDIWG